MRFRFRRPDVISAADFLPPDRSLPELTEAAQGCRGCELYQRATQTVFGAGPPDAVAMFVGEQPGDQEDRQGHPFVGPAGRLLDEGLDAAGIDRTRVYVTNAVKHYKWVPRGTRRLHKKPDSRELAACRPWLEAELAAVRPHALVLLGATAAQSLLGRAFRITASRGRPLASDYAPWTMATWHPSAVLRIPERTARHRMRAEFFVDLRLLAEELRQRGEIRT